MNLKNLRKNWDAFGKADPMWAIITNPDKKGNKWDKDEFFLTGRREIGNLIRYINSLHFEIKRKKVLDFGCGIGRLSQALARHFESVHGVDIANVLDQTNKSGSKKLF